MTAPRFLLLVFLLESILSVALYGAEPKIETIGHSVEGRPIEAYMFTAGEDGEQETTLLIYGGIHGGYEWNTVVLSRELIEYFSSRSDSGKSKIPGGLRLYIIPVLNPDGLHRITGGAALEKFDFSSAPIEEGRLNARAVDLNRNWDNNWEPKAYWRSREVSAGERPFSEPETRTLRDFVKRIKPGFIISYHSAANGIYYAGKRDRWKPARRLAQLYSSASGYPIPESSLVGYRITGASTGYFRSLGIPAMVVELEGRGGPEFKKNRAGVLAVIDEIVEGEEE